MAASWTEAFLLCAGTGGLLPLPLLVRCSRVCRLWLHDVRYALATAKRLEFGDFSARVKGGDIKCLLGHMSGVNLQAVDLRGCQLSASDDIQDILSSIAHSCPGVVVIDLTGCSEYLVLRAIAVQAMLHRSPPALYRTLLACRATAADRIPFPECYMCCSSSPRLIFDAHALPSRNALLEACRRGDHLVASLLLKVCIPAEQGQAWTFDCNSQDGHGRSPLFFAARSGCEQLVSLLISAGSDVNATDFQGDSPILLACAAGRLSAATRLLDASADCGKVNTISGNTPLLAACQAGCCGIARLLFARGKADVDKARGDGATPLSLAVASEQTELILLILKHVKGRFSRPHDATEDRATKLKRLAQLYIENDSVDAWLASGVSERAIVGEIGALLSSYMLDETLKDELRTRRSLVNSISWVRRSLLCAPSCDGEEPSPLRPLHTIYATDGIQSVAVHGSRLARAEGVFVVVCDILTGFEQLRMRGGSDLVRAVDFSHDGQMLASASNEKTLVLWDLETGDVQQELKHHSDWVYAVAFSPRNRVLASGGRDEAVRLWYGSQGHACTCSLEGHNSRVTCVAWSPCGSWLASAGGDNCVKIWHAETHRCRLTMEGHSSKILCVAVSQRPVTPRDSVTVASGSFDNTVRLWDSQTGECFMSLVGHAWAVSCVAFSPHDATVVSGSWDHSIRCWNLCSGDCLRVIEGHTGVVTSLSFSSKGEWLISGSEDKSICVWDWLK